MGKTMTRDQFTPDETTRRMEAALRGARIAGPQHKIVTPKRAKTQRAKRKKPAK